MKMDPTTLPLSDPCYLPIYEEETVRDGIKRQCLTDIWSNFLEGAYPGTGTRSASELILNWNGTLINDVIVFDTEQDKMWFILRWS